MIIRAAHGVAEVNPHFTYHAVVPVGGEWYDPSYGLHYASLTFDETAYSGSVDQKTSTTFPTTIIQDRVDV